EAGPGARAMFYRDTNTTSSTLGLPKSPSFHSGLDLVAAAADPGSNTVAGLSQISGNGAVISLELKKIPVCPDLCSVTPPAMAILERYTLSKSKEFQNLAKNPDIVPLAPIINPVTVILSKSTSSEQQELNTLNSDSTIFVNMRKRLHKITRLNMQDEKQSFSNLKLPEDKHTITFKPYYCLRCRIFKCYYINISIASVMGIRWTSSYTVISPEERIPKTISKEYVVNIINFLFFASPKQLENCKIIFNFWRRLIPECLATHINKLKIFSRKAIMVTKIGFHELTTLHGYILVLQFHMCDTSELLLFTGKKYLVFHRVSTTAKDKKYSLITCST
ncbi:hypothetical protein L9F63_009518, partial [Diploptera punctata]